MGNASRLMSQDKGSPSFTRVDPSPIQSRAPHLLRLARRLRRAQPLRSVLGTDEVWWLHLRASSPPGWGARWARGGAGGGPRRPRPSAPAPWSQGLPALLCVWDCPVSRWPESLGGEKGCAREFLGS